MKLVSKTSNRFFHMVILAVCLGLGFLANPSYAQKGKGTVGGGGLDIERDRYEGTSWFVGTKKVIRACFVKDSSFKLDDRELKDTFLSSVSVWKNYYLKLRREIRQADQFSPEGVLSFNFSISMSCKGSEDLTVYFGASNKEIELEKLRYRDPISLVSRTSYNKSIGWSRGFIWLSKDLAGLPNFSARVVKSVLLHELGHIFGCEHIPGTIMDENFTRAILYPREYVNENLAPIGYEVPSDSIDGENQLYPLSGIIRGKTPISFCTNILGFSCYSQENHYGLNSVAEVGINAIQIKFVLDSKTYAFQITEIEDLLETDDNVFGGGVLDLHKGKFIFNTLTEGIRIASGNFAGFYSGAVLESYEGGLSMVLRGNLHFGRLGKIPVTILRNLKGGKIRIDYKHNGRKYTLFADTYYTK